MIKQNVLSPALFIVTVVALLALLSLVNVDIGVTGQALRLHAVFVQRTAVARVAGELRVCSGQLEIRITQVVEMCLLPRKFRVAVGARFAIIAIVGIVAAMTIQALLWGQVVPARTLVATGAR